MARTILIDELLVTVYAPERLPEKEYRAMRRTLTGARFRAVLERALQEVFQQYPSLNKVRITLSR